MRVIARRVRAARRALGITRDDLARLLGASYNAVVSWELGRRTPSPQYLEKIDRLHQPRRRT